MNNDEYQVIKIDGETKRIFVTRNPIVPKNKDEEVMMQVDKKIEAINFSQLPNKHPEFRADECEIIDVTDWKYNDFTDLLNQISNYGKEASSKKR